MLKSELLRLLQQEIRRHDFSRSLTSHQGENQHDATVFRSSTGWTRTGTSGVWAPPKKTAQLSGR